MIVQPFSVGRDASLYGSKKILLDAIKKKVHHKNGVMIC
jgi:hypothetical protein